MLKVYSILYRIVLALFVLLMFAAQMIVGVAGHNQDWGFTDYLPLIYSIVTFATLWAYAKIGIGYMKRPLRNINMVLVGIGVVAIAYVLVTTIVNDGFIAELIITETLFIGLGVMLMYSLITDK